MVMLWIAARRKSCWPGMRKERIMMTTDSTIGDSPLSFKAEGSSPEFSRNKPPLRSAAIEQLRLPVRHIAEILVDAARSFFWIALLEGIGGRKMSWNSVIQIDGSGKKGERVPVQYRVKKRVVG